MSDVLNQVFGRVVVGEKDLAAVDPAMAEAFPFWTALMTETPKVNGRRRLPCTMTFVCEDGVWKGGLRDRDHQVSLWASAASFTGVVEALEKALHETPVPWRKAQADFRSRQKT